MYFRQMQINVIFVKTILLKDRHEILPSWTKASYQLIIIGIFVNLHLSTMEK